MRMAFQRSSLPRRFLGRLRHALIAVTLVLGAHSTTSWVCTYARSARLHGRLVARSRQIPSSAGRPPRFNSGWAGTVSYAAREGRSLPMEERGPLGLQGE